MRKSGPSVSILATVVNSLIVEAGRKKRSESRLYKTWPESRDSIRIPQRERENLGSRAIALISASSTAGHIDLGSIAITGPEKLSRVEMRAIAIDFIVLILENCSKDVEIYKLSVLI